MNILKLAKLIPVCTVCGKIFYSDTRKIVCKECLRKCKA